MEKRHLVKGQHKRRILLKDSQLLRLKPKASTEEEEVEEGIEEGMSHSRGQMKSFRVLFTILLRLLLLLPSFKRRLFLCKS